WLPGPKKSSAPPCCGSEKLSSRRDQQSVNRQCRAVAAICGAVMLMTRYGDNDWMTSRHFSRRALARNGLALAGAMTFAGSAWAQQDISAELAKPSPLGDEVLGKADAPVTIIEYASMTCSHCAHFHAKTF